MHSSAVPDNSEVHHALGLSLIRQKRNKDATGELKLAATLNPGNARYVYAVALNSTGAENQAILVLQGANAAHPDNIEILKALISFHRDLGHETAAKKYAEKLRGISP